MVAASKNKQLKGAQQTLVKKSSGARCRRSAEDISLILNKYREMQHKPATVAAFVHFWNETQKKSAEPLLNRKSFDAWLNQEKQYLQRRSNEMKCRTKTTLYEYTRDYFKDVRQREATGDIQFTAKYVFTTMILINKYLQKNKRNYPDYVAPKLSKQYVWRFCSEHKHLILASKPRNKQRAEEINREIRKLSDTETGVEVRWINEHMGYGLFATQNFQKGTCILEYKGTLIKYTDTLNPFKDTSYVWCSGSSEGATVVDAQYTYAGFARFINDNFDPATKANTIIEMKEGKAAVITQSDILINDQITLNYSSSYWGELVDCNVLPKREINDIVNKYPELRKRVIKRTR